MSGSIPISQLPAAAGVNPTDLLVLVEVGTPNVTKQAPVQSLLGGNLSASFGATEVASLTAAGAITGAAVTGTSGSFGPLTAAAITAASLSFGQDITLGEDGDNGMSFVSSASTYNVQIGSNGNKQFSVQNGIGGSVTTNSVVTAGGSISLTSATNTNTYATFGYVGHGGNIGSIAASGTNAVAYNTTSDYRLKVTFGEISAASVIDLLRLTPVHDAAWANEKDRRRPMMLAHEMPAWAVTGARDAVDENGDPVWQQVDYMALVPTLWAAARHLLNEVDALRAEIAALRKGV